MRKKILVRGPILTQSGYGEHARLVLRSLRTREDIFDIYAAPVGWGKTNWIWEDTDERKWFDEVIEKTIHYIAEKGQFDASMQVTIPNEWDKLAPINIGVTAGIETTQVAPVWIEKSRLVDKILTISNHSKNVYQGTSYSVRNNDTGEEIEDFKTLTPIEVIHYPVKETTKADVEFEFDTEFNFLAVAQWGPRKNIENTVKWFVEEFIDKEVGLIVKTSVAKNCVYDRVLCEHNIKKILSAYPQRKCKIYLLHGFLKEEEMSALYSHDKVKAFVTLAHGEGFGLPIFEAAYHGLPVISPAWSGQVDFLYMSQRDKKGKIKNKPMFATVEYTIQQIPESVVWDGVLHAESKWCVPEQGSYKMRLREVYGDYGRFEKRAKILKEWIKQNFKEDEQHKKYVNAVLELTGNIVSDDEEIDNLFAEISQE